MIKTLYSTFNSSFRFIELFNCTFRQFMYFLVAQLSRTVHTITKIHTTVHRRNTTQLNSWEWEVPTNGIFSNIFLGGSSTPRTPRAAAAARVSSRGGVAAKFGLHYIKAINHGIDHKSYALSRPILASKSSPFLNLFSGTNLYMKNSSFSRLKMQKTQPLQRIKRQIEDYVQRCSAIRLLKTAAACSTQRS